MNCPGCNQEHAWDARYFDGRRILLECVNVPRDRAYFMKFGVEQEDEIRRRAERNRSA